MKSIKALEWYKEIAESTLRYSAAGNGTALSAIIVELSNDAGRRAREAIEYAQQFKDGQRTPADDAVEFGEWIGKEDLKLYAEGWCQPGGSNGMHLSTKELYKLFKGE